MTSDMSTLGLALGAILALVGFIIAFFLWRSKGAAYGLRGVAWALVPLAAGLLGLMQAVIMFASSLVGIVAGLVFNPIVWAGTALAGTAVLLYFVSGVMKAKGVGVSAAKGKAGRTRKKAPETAEEGTPSPQVGGARPAPDGGRPAGGGEDFSDIEALLKKRGIE